MNDARTDPVRPSRSPTRWLAEAVGVVLGYLVIAVTATWPIAADPSGNSLAGPYANDIRFNLFVIFWGAHALVTDPLQLHHTNMFYPERFTFAYSDIELSHSLLMLPVIRLFNDPVLTYNLLLITSLVLGATGFYLLAHRLTDSSVAAFLGGAVFVLIPTHFSRHLQIQFVTDHWLPWLAWALVRWRDGIRGAAERTRPRRSLVAALVAAVFFCLHALTGAHNALFGALLVAWMAAVFAVRDGLWRSRSFATGLLVFALVSIAVLAPLFTPYLHLQDEMEAQRVHGEDVLAAGSLGWHELLTARTRFYRRVADATGWPAAMFRRPSRNEFFPGLVPLVLAALAVLGAGGSGATAERRWALAWVFDGLLVATTVSAVVLASTGTDRLWLLFLPLPAPPTWTLAAIAIGLLLARRRLAPAPEHALVAVARAAWIGARRDGALWPWLVLTALCLALAAGPSGGLYTLLARLPGIGLVRVPSRFVLLASFSLSVLATYGAAWLVRGRARIRGRWVLAALTVFFAVEACNAPLRVYPPVEATEAARWLARQEGDFAILEVPISPDDPTIAARQVLDSVHHWKKLLIGYSGYRTEANAARMRRLDRGFPAPEILDELVALDVRYVLVREDRIDRGTLEDVRSASRLSRVRELDGVVVYELLPSAS